MRRFNVTGLCNPRKHYMVNINNKLEKIVELIDKEHYFTINRARQYGKTTTLASLRRLLQGDYIVISISFEDLGKAHFESEEAFCYEFMHSIQDALEFTNTTEDYKESWFNKEAKNFKNLSRHITKMTKGKRLVLMIDEVDKVSNNELFLNFLSVLRSKYLAREDERDYTFHSVILASVYDIKNIKLKLINEGIYTPTATENKLFNSPWNIAVDFNVDMSFNSQEISTMLVDYEADHQMGMNIMEIAKEIHRFTGGYPFLVSRICQHIDESLDKDWTLSGVKKAMKLLLKEKSVLFDDLFKNLKDNSELYNLIYDVLIIGRKRIFIIDDTTIELADRYGYIKEEDDRIKIANKIFEIRICNFFIAQDEKISPEPFNEHLFYEITKNGKFNMELCLERFAGHYEKIYNDIDAEFIEREGRLIFLSYLAPLLNGQGFYHLESQFTNSTRMDIVVDFGSDQFIIELKLWNGDSLKEKAYKQLLGYMDSANANKGYLLTFDFRHKKNRERKAEWVQFDDKQIFDVMV